MAVGGPAGVAVSLGVSDGAGVAVMMMTIGVSVGISVVVGRALRPIVVAVGKLKLIGVLVLSGAKVIPGGGVKVATPGMITFWLDLGRSSR